MEIRGYTCVACLVLAAIVSSAAASVPEYFISDHCSQTLALSHESVQAVRLRLTKTPQYPDSMRCAMRLQAPEGKKLLLRIQTLDVHGSQASLCQDGDYLQIFDGSTESSPIIQGQPQAICEKPKVEHISTSGNYLVLRFISNQDKLTDAGLSMTITAFNDGPCEKDQFRCGGTGECLQIALKCDGRQQCPDGSDEALPQCLTTAAIVGLSVAGVVVLVAIIVAIVVGCLVYGRRKKARIIKLNYETSKTFPLTYPNSSSHLKSQGSQTISTSEIKSQDKKNPDVTLLSSSPKSNASVIPDISALVKSYSDTEHSSSEKSYVIRPDRASFVESYKISPNSASTLKVRSHGPISAQSSTSSQHSTPKVHYVDEQNKDIIPVSDSETTHPELSPNVLKHRDLSPNISTKGDQHSGITHQVLEPKNSNAFIESLSVFLEKNHGVLQKSISNGSVMPNKPANDNIATAPADNYSCRQLLPINDVKHSDEETHSSFHFPPRRQGAVKIGTNSDRSNDVNKPIGMSTFLSKKDYLTQDAESQSSLNLSGFSVSLATSDDMISDATVSDSSDW